MSSEESSASFDSATLVRKSQKNVDRLVVSVSPSIDSEPSPGASDSESGDRAASSSSRRPRQTTDKGDDSSEEEHTSLAALKEKKKKRKIETQSDLKTARARKEAADREGKKEADRQKKTKRREQLKALKAVPIFGLGLGRCPHIVLEHHDDKPSSSTYDSVVACGDERNCRA